MYPPHSFLGCRRCSLALEARGLPCSNTTKHKCNAQVALFFFLGKPKFKIIPLPCLSFLQLILCFKSFITHLSFPSRLSTLVFSLLSSRCCPPTLSSLFLFSWFVLVCFVVVLSGSVSHSALSFPCDSTSTLQFHSTIFLAPRLADYTGSSVSLLFHGCWSPLTLVIFSTITLH